MAATVGNSVFEILKLSTVWELVVDATDFGEISPVELEAAKTKEEEVNVLSTTIWTKAASNCSSASTRHCTNHYVDAATR